MSIASLIFISTTKKHSKQVPSNQVKTNRLKTIEMIKLAVAVKIKLASFSYFLFVNRLNMKLFAFSGCFCLLQLFCHCEKLDKTVFDVSNHTILVDAVEIFVRNVFGNTVNTENFISAESVSTNDFKDELLRKSSGAIYRQESASKIQLLRGRKRHFSIFFIESFEEFIEIYNVITAKSFRLNGYYLIVLVKGEIEEVQEIFKLLWKLQIFNVNVIFEAENQEVLVNTFVPFNDRSCNDTTPIVVNTFKYGKFKNDVSTFFARKMNNLQNCSIEIAVTSLSEPYVFAKELSNGGYHFAGQDVNLVRALSHTMNFFANFTFIENVGFIFENGSAEGSFQLLLDGETDLVVSGWLLKAYRLKFFDATTPYNMDELVFLVPPGTDFTSIEKLIFPLSLNLWIAILVCFLVGLVLIFFIKSRSRKVQRFVFGSDVSHPILNMFAIFVGDSQKRLPKKNFARFLLAIFLIYSLIIRTIYQASFYELLKSNRRYNAVESIKEMIEKDFTFYLNYGITDLLEGSDGIKSRFDRFQNTRIFEFSFEFLQIVSDCLRELSVLRGEAAKQSKLQRCCC